MKKKAFIFIILAGILWGTSGIFFNLLKPYGFSPLQMTAMRGVVSACCFLGYALLLKRDLLKITKKEALMFLGSGISIYATAAFYYASIEASSVPTAVVLMYTAPVLVMGYSCLFLGEKLNKLKITAVILVVVGCVLVSGVIGGGDFRPMGVLLGIGASVSYSAYNIFTKYSMLRGSNSVSATLYCFFVMGVLSIAFCKPVEFIELTAKAPVPIIFLILGIGLCTCVVPYFLYTLALKEIPAGTASALGILEPLSATIFSIILFGEKLSLLVSLGIILIFLAVYLLRPKEKA